MPTLDSAPVLGVILSGGLQGVWLFDPTSPSTTSVQYLYGNVGRAEGLGVENAGLQFVGRAYPVYDFGMAEVLSLSLSFTIPFSSTHDAEVLTLRTLVRNRRTLAYRDGRNRLVYGILTGITVTDSKHGTVVATTLTAIDYSDVV
jgi:hypothetical protein